MREPAAIDKLAKLFTRFPGIGGRQARRFVYFLLTLNQAERNNLSASIAALGAAVRECELCHRFFDSNSDKFTLCDLCRDPARDGTSLMVVEKDADVAVVERSGAYPGRYFILGGLLPILDKAPASRIRSEELVTRVTSDKNLNEVIIALAASSEGDNTVDYLKPLLLQALIKTKVKITLLGRGLSTGSELEYADTDTLKNAFKNRQ